MVGMMFMTPLTLAVSLTAAPASFAEPVPGTSLSITMIPIQCSDDAPTIGVARDETSWDLYDSLVYRLDVPKGEADDDGGLTRPTKPYLMADRGWGHAGYPALSVNHTGAEAFCAWMSAKTGRPWRLPTVAEWKAMCATSGITPQELTKYAWVKDNAKRKTHPLGSLAPDANGLHDLHGDVAEWCTTPDGRFVLMGLSYLDATPTELCSAQKTPVPEWNDTDPQIPKSIWWLSDAAFAGFRVVCETPPPAATNSSEDPEKEPTS